MKKVKLILRNPWSRKQTWTLGPGDFGLPGPHGLVFTPNEPLEVTADEAWLLLKADRRKMSSRYFELVEGETLEEKEPPTNTTPPADTVPPIAKNR